MATVIPHPGRTLDPENLVAFPEPRMNRFMVPRYIDIAESRPKTLTGKIRKVALRDAGVTATTQRSREGRDQPPAMTPPRDRHCTLSTGRRPARARVSVAFASPAASARADHPSRRLTAPGQLSGLDESCRRLPGPASRNAKATRPPPRRRTKPLQMTRPRLDPGPASRAAGDVVRGIVRSMNDVRVACRRHRAAVKLACVEDMDRIDGQRRPPLRARRSGLGRRYRGRVCLPLHPCHPE